MAIASDDPIVEIEHDHTHLDVLFEDLRAVAREGLAATDVPELLEDARVNWTYLQEEIIRHFVREERKLFSNLEVRFPDLTTTIRELCTQHQTLRRELSELGAMLKAPLEAPAQSRDAFDARWQRLEALWQQHADTEWTLIQDIIARNSNAEASSEVGEEG